MKLRPSEKAMLKADIIVNLQFMGGISGENEAAAVGSIISRMPNHHLNYLSKKLSKAAYNFKQLKEKQCAGS